MIVPSIDIMDGAAVQLIGGCEKALDAGDPRPLARRFGLVGEVAVIDLDAALGRGSNEALIRELLELAPCRVGGGIRSVERAIQWLDWGAEKVILGTAATPGVLRQLPRERVIAALDAVHGEVVVDGWRTATGRSVVDCMAELEPFVSGFLVTFVEREGRMQGIDLEEVARLAAASGAARLTAAGGVTTSDHVAVMDQLGIDAQIGMALYTGRLELAEAFTAPLWSDRQDGLWPTVVCDAHGAALGLVYSSLESVREALRIGRGVYHSRRRGLWIKGESSGDWQQLLRIDVDCDRDALRFVVRQHGSGFCHRGLKTCWGQPRGLTGLEHRVTERLHSAPAGSYTTRLAREPELLRTKLLEEAGELAEAMDVAHVTHEAADVLYFALCKLGASGVTMEDVARELDRRARQVTRRRGGVKPQGMTAREVRR